jgi:hypothetical protein
MTRDSRPELRIRHASQPWILSLDADEVVTADLRDPPPAPHRVLGSPDTVWRASPTTGRFIRHRLVPNPVLLFRAGRTIHRRVRTKRW